MNAYYLYDIDV